MKFISSLLLFIFLSIGCADNSQQSQVEPNDANPFLWENATIYFLLTDRFNNGNPENDFSFDRKQDGAVLRSFMGGDIKGITEKIKSGYFNDLGVTAIWTTPLVEQIPDHTDEGTGKTYAFHGYWARDWTALDPNFGTFADLKEMVQEAHKRGIRILMDAVLNHTGPVTPLGTVWPSDWVRTSPPCNFQDYAGTVECTLVENLPDIYTEGTNEVDLPPFLVEKWKAEGRYEKEIQELDTFFAETGYPRTPRYYLIKWMTDWVRELGIDGFRVDTTKHTEAEIWAELKKEAQRALAAWRKEHPEEVLDETPFYMVGEVYGYNVHGGRDYDYGDKKVDFFANGYEALINFAFKEDAKGDYEPLFSKYADYMNSAAFDGKSVVNYVSSHDDGGPFDRERKRAMESATKIMLTPGAAQIYYGDEIARVLSAEGAQGDANLRSFMNWEEIEANSERNGQNIPELLSHWQKLGKFRQDHVSVGAGTHTRLSKKPYVFARNYQKNGQSDKVVVGLDMEAGKKTISTGDVFEDGTVLKDYYSGQSATVQNGKAVVDSEFGIVLLGE